MLPTDASARKAVPLYSGLVCYFPRALIAVAQCSQRGNDQHNPGEPLHWAREKSTDHADCLLRHLFDDALGAAVDGDGIEHLTKVAWRALAHLELALERRVPRVSREPEVPPGSPDALVDALLPPGAKPGED